MRTNKKKKTDKVGSIGKQSGGICGVSPEEKRKATVGSFAERKAFAEISTVED